MTQREQALADLQAARALIEDPARWTQHTTARARDGARTSAQADNACRWCATGALVRIAAPPNRWPGIPRPRVDVAVEILRRAALQTGAHMVPSEVNDELGHAATMEMYDRAVRIAASPETLLTR